MQGGIKPALVPQVMVAMNVVYMLSAYPFGKLADSMNHMRLLVIGLGFLVHFKRLNPDLAGLIHRGVVLSHPLIVGEIACGTPPEREQLLRDLADLPQSNHISVSEVVDFIERERLYGKGCGLIDVMLLASARVTRATKLWTLDQRQATLADRFGILYAPALL